MKWFQNRSIRVKLTLCFCILSGLIGLLGWEALHDIRKTAQKSTDMYENMTVPLAQLTALSEDFQRLRINLRDMVFAETSADEQRFLHTVRELEERGTDDLLAFEQRILSDEMRVAFAELKAAKQAFHPHMEQVIAYAEAEDMDEAAIATLKGPAYAAAMDVVAAYSTVRDMKQQHASKLQASTETFVQGLERTVWLTLLVSFAIAFLIGWALSQALVRPVQSLNEAAAAVAEGNYAIALDTSRRDELGLLNRAFLKMAQMIQETLIEAEALQQEAEVAAQQAQQIASEAEADRAYLRSRIDEMLDVMNRFAEGDLTVQLTSSGDDDIARLYAGFNRAVDQLNVMLAQVHEAVDQTASASSQISATTEELAATAHEQSAQTEEVASASEEMIQTIATNADSAHQAARAAQAGGTAAHDGGQIVEATIAKIREIAAVVNESSQTVERLGTSSAQIGAIIQVIDDIANQTNLLALNAAIEAARAGEQGRGFAVVADEVRKLAERTTQATREITGMITQIQQDTSQAVVAMQRGTEEVDQGLALADQTGQALRTIVSQAGTTADMVHLIATANEEQSETSQQIMHSITAISQAAGESAQAVGEIAHSTEHLNQLTQSLTKLLASFSLRQATHATERAPVARVVPRPRSRHAA